MSCSRLPVPPQALCTFASGQLRVELASSSLVDCGSTADSAVRKQRVSRFLSCLLARHQWQEVVVSETGSYFTGIARPRTWPDGCNNTHFHSPKLTPQLCAGHWGSEDTAMEEGRALSCSGAGTHCRTQDQITGALTICRQGCPQTVFHGV